MKARGRRSTPTRPTSIEGTFLSSEDRGHFYFALTHASISLDSENLEAYRYWYHVTQDGGSYGDATGLMSASSMNRLSTAYR